MGSADHPGFHSFRPPSHPKDNNNNNTIATITPALYVTDRYKRDLNFYNTSRR